MLYLRNTKGMSAKVLVRAIFEWDVRTWSIALEAWLPVMKKMALEIEKPTAIDIGGRNGGLSLLAAIEGFQVNCSDLENPEESAGKLHSAFGVSDAVTYTELDVLAVPTSFHHEYDIVLFKSILGGIGRKQRNDLQVQAIRNMGMMLKEGGQICFAENLQGSRLHQFFRKRFTRWGADWNYPSYQRLIATFEEAGFDVNMKQRGFLAAFGRTEKQRAFFALFDRYLLNFITPPSWKYLAYGVAQKKND